MGGPDPRIWDDILAHLRRNHPEMRRRWFNDLRVSSFERGVLRVEVRDAVQLQYLQLEWRDRFSAAAQAVTEMLVTVHFHGPASRVPGDAGSTAGAIPTSPEGAERSEVHRLHPEENDEVDARRAGTPDPDGHAALLDNVEGDIDGADGLDGYGTAASRREVGRSASSSIGTSRNPARAKGELEMPAPRGSAAWGLDGPGLPREQVGRTLDDARIVIGSQAINPDYTFENFIEGPNNQLAYAAAIGVANHPGTSYNPYFVHGGVGLGKTHLLQALCQHLLREREGIRIYYVSCDDFTNHFMEAVQAGQMANFRNQFRNVDVLVVDDIHFLSGHERTQEEFFHTFNALTQAQKQIVLSSDAAPNEIPALEDRLVSRFNSGLVARIEKPGYETRVAILRQKAEIRELAVPREVIALIARQIDSNIRELEGALNQLQVRAEVKRSSITVDMAREIFVEKAPRKTAPIPVHAIIDRVATHYGRKASEIMGRRRLRSVAWPRQVGMYLTRQLTDHSFQEIGDIFGGRDHTTVMHAMSKIDAMRADDEQVNDEIRQLEERIRESHLLGEL